jgi:hypothetical protein
MFQPLAAPHWRIVHLAAYNPHQMLLPVFALMIHSAMSQSGAASSAAADRVQADDKAGAKLVCEVLRHPEQYVGRRITLRGFFTQY